MKRVIKKGYIIMLLLLTVCGNAKAIKADNGQGDPDCNPYHNPYYYPYCYPYAYYPSYNSGTADPHPHGSDEPQYKHRHPVKKLGFVN